MRKPALLLVLVLCMQGTSANPAVAQEHVQPVQAASPPRAAVFDAAAAQRFAKLALACVHKEYPNKLTHSLDSDADVAPAQAYACVLRLP